MGHERKQPQRSRVKNGSNLVPVTLRLSAQDRDHIAALARMHGSNVSQYLRILIDEYGGRGEFQRTLNDMLAQLNLLSERVQHSRGAGPANSIIAEQLAQHDSAEIKSLLSRTTASVEQCTQLIQGSFAQLFEAFFKLQSFLESTTKGQVGRR